MAHPNKFPPKQHARRNDSQGINILLGVLIAIPSGYTVIVGHWPVGYVMLAISLIIISSAVVCNTEPFKKWGRFFPSSGSLESSFKTMPGYRLRFYSFVFAWISLMLVWYFSDEIYTALMSGAISTYSGPKGNRIKEVIFQDVRPVRFWWGVISSLFMILLLGVSSVVMIRRVILGRRAFEK